MPGGAKADAQNIYVATVNTPKAGKYWLLAQPVGAKYQIQALGDLTVGKHTKAPVRRRPRDPVGQPDPEAGCEAEHDHDRGTARPRSF